MPKKPNATTVNSCRAVKPITSCLRIANTAISVALARTKRRQADNSGAISAAMYLPATKVPPQMHETITNFAYTEYPVVLGAITAVLCMFIHPFMSRTPCPYVNAHAYSLKN